MGKNKVIVPFLSFIGSLFLMGTFSQSGSTPQEAVRLQKPFQHEVSVTLKLVQVYVTDKKGKPVQDLTKKDFIVRDNGREMTLTEFERHILEAAPQRPRPPAAEEIIIATATPPATVMNRKFFLFFDFANNYARGVNKAKEAALHFLDTGLIPGDEVGLLSYSMLKGLSIHEYLTVDHKKISEAIADFSAKDIAGRAEDFESEYWRKAAEGIPGGAEGVYSKSRFQLEAERRESKNQAQIFILKLTDLAKALRYVPGKKHLMLFSTGIVTSLIYYGMAGAPTGGNAPLKNVDVGDFVLRTQYEEMLKELSAANCSIFAFDTREAAMVSSMFDYDKQTFEEHWRNILSVDGARTPINVFKDDKTTGFYTLSRLATVTGGKYYSNIEEYDKNLEELQNLTGSYYVLGYPIGEQWDGKFHTIKVEVKRKGVEVRAQTGYFNPKPFREYSDLEKQLHLFDLALSDRPLLQTPLAFSMTGLAYSASAGQRLQMLAKIPNEVVELFAGKKVEIIALVFDDKENLADLQRTEADLTKYRGMDVFYASGAALQPGNYKCRLVVRDLENGRGAVASARVNIAPAPFAGLSLHSPLLLVPGSNFLYLEPAARQAGTADWRTAYPYDRAQYSPVLGEVPAGTPKLGILVPCSFPGLIHSNIALTAWLIDAVNGTRISLSGSILERTPNDSGESIFAELSLENISPGAYRLFVHAEESGSKAVAYAQTPLIIK